MGVKVKKGEFTANTGTGNQSVTGVGFAPSAIIVWGVKTTATGYTGATMSFSYGVATSATQRWCATISADDAAPTSNSARRLSTDALIYHLPDGATTSAAECVADLVSLDSDGFTINWSDAPGSAWLFHYLAIGGSSVTNAKAGTFTLATSGTPQAFTDPGFQPDLLLTVGANATATGSNASGAAFSWGAASGAANEGSLAMSDRDGQATMTCLSEQDEASCVLAVATGSTARSAQANLASFDATGFTLNVTTLPTAAMTFGYLALKGGSYKVLTDTQRTSTTGTKATTGAGFQPSGAMFASWGWQDATSFDASRAAVSIFGADGTAEGGTWWEFDDGVADSAIDYNHVSDKALLLANQPSTTTAAADLSSFDSDGFTLDYTTVADATARQFHAVLFGPPEASSTNVNGSDSAAAAEGTTGLQADLTTRTDTGGATEQATQVTAATTRTDADTATEGTTGLAADTARTDAATATEGTTSATATATATDAGTATDASSVTVSGTNVDVADTAAATEGTTTLSPTITTRTDTGTATDTAAVAASATRTDTGTGTEGTTTVAVPRDATDTASASEGTTAGTAAVTATDTAAATDATTSIAPSITTRTDSAAAAEGTTSITVPRTGSDTATATEGAGSVTATVATSRSRPRLVRPASRRVEVSVRIKPPGHDWVTIGTDVARGAVPQGANLTWNDKGPDTASFTLRRRSPIPYHDLTPGSWVEVLVSGRVEWDGRLHTVSDQDGDDRQLTLTCKGWQYHLDDGSYRKLYVHRNLGEWQDVRSHPSASLAEFGGGGSLNLQSDRGVLTWALAGGVALPTAANGGRSGVFLDGGSTGAIKRVIVTWESANNTSNIDTYLFYSDSDPSAYSGAGAYSPIATWNGGASGTFAVTLATARRYVSLVANNNGASAYTPLGPTWFRVTAARAFGATAYEASNDSALEAQVVIADAITQAAPLLTATDLADGAFNIPELAFPDEWRTPRQVIEAVNAFHDYLYGVRVGRTVYWQPRPAAGDVEVEIGPWRGARFSGGGESYDDLYNTVRIQAVDENGQPLWVERTATSPRLTALGVTRAYQLTTQARLSQAAAEAVGDAWLARKGLTPFRGSVTVQGTGGARLAATTDPVPAVSLGRMAGKRLRVAGRFNPDTGGKGREGEITSVTWAQDTDTANVQLDQRTDSIEAFLARMAAVRRAIT